MKMPDIDAIQAFVLVAELKSFTRAADAIGGTQAAISLKIKRLEETLGRKRCVDVEQQFNLPPLPSREIVLYTAQRDAQAQSLISTLSANISNS
jgi:hypothetical protein